MAQILVTGGCGYIGSHIVKLLTESGEKVLVYDNLSQGNKSNLLHGEELIIGDIRDVQTLDQLFATHDIEMVVHLAALVNAAESVTMPDLYHAVNAEGSRNVWRIAAQHNVKHGLYSSSAAVYGTPNSNAPITESHSLAPSSPYGATKLAGEQSLLEYFHSHVAFRFFNVGGAEPEGKIGQSPQSRAIMPRLFAAARSRSSIIINGHDYPTTDGTVIRDFIHVLDIARAFALAIKLLREGRGVGIYNLGGGTPTSMQQLHDMVEKITNTSIPITKAPRTVGDISYSLADINLAQKVLGWQPQETLQSIIRDGWNYYVQSNS